eukprot:TRINITY_DN1990_c0_g1_i2.p1 TRINITY_DN1990_c0_g1~~TRINITY_DN1990_c0_g1_i2.p1  ORF type:complete len:185 (-),score=24.24 TRINITY_DN1990_c0_g1_i2:124-678(-)
MLVGTINDVDAMIQLVILLNVTLKLKVYIISSITYLKGLLITSMVSLYQGLMTNRTWTEIEATVTVAKKLRITESKSILYDLQYEYQDPLLLEYMDEYDDEIITGTTYRIGQPLPFSYIYHNEIQVGDKIVAYYNPSYRSQSTVKTGMSKVGFICVGVAFTFLILPSMARLKVSPAEARKIMNS